MYKLKTVARFFAGINRKKPRENYYFNVLMVMILSKMPLRKLLSLKISDLDNNLFRMRYHKVDPVYFDFLKRYSQEKGSIYLLVNRTRWCYQDFCRKINKRMGTDLKMHDLKKKNKWEDDI